jgi:hypothetical protein
MVRSGKALEPQTALSIRCQNCGHVFTDLNGIAIVLNSHDRILPTAAKLHRMHPL